MPDSAADRIRAMIAAARSTAKGELDMHEIYVKALVRCGIGREEATELLASNDQDPVARILHFAGDSHNFAILAIEEALAAA
ncbi:MAG: hypothetical protein H7Y60_08605 [Rhodospirillaceae bacterium]|nr:hypothetical protein [Rhodospirillales bacterium]